MASSTRGTYRALVIASHDAPPQVVTRPAPQPTPGTVLVRVIAAPVLAYAKEVYPPTNTRGYKYPLPLVPGTSAIARIETGDPDAAPAGDDSNSLLKNGQLVLVSGYVRGRTDTRAGLQPRYLSGLHEGFTPTSAALMANWARDGTYAELAVVPVENVFVLEEQRLLGDPRQGGLGIDIHKLAQFADMAVPYGGLRAVGLQPGETVAIGPATGNFGGAAVVVALAMGARVVAMGRSAERLAMVRERAAKTGRGAQLVTMEIQGDMDKDLAALQPVAGLRCGLDVFFDISPPQAAGPQGEAPAYVTAGIRSLRHGGRCCLMGGLRGNVALPYERMIHFDITLQGKWMFEADDVRNLIRMAEAGVLGFDWVTVAGKFGLDQWQEAWKIAADTAGMGSTTLIVP